MNTEFTKKLAERVHAQARLEELYGISLSGKEYKAVIRSISESTRTNPTARLIERTSQRVSVWEVPYNGQFLKAVYDGKRKEIITFKQSQNNHEQLMAA